MNKDLLQIQNLSIAYQANNMVVDNVSLSIHEGEIITIVGESGSGKSTLIHSILGILNPSATIHQGVIQYGDYELQKMTPKLRQKITGTEISMIFQNSESHFDPIKKIKKQFDEFLLVHKKMSKKELLELEIETFHQMGFKDPLRVLHSYPFELSGGMQQRVSLGMAIALKPKLILADEPTSALDVTLERQIIKEMVELVETMNTALLLVTHNMGVAAYLSDKIAVMKNGSLVEFALRDQIINNPQHEYTRELLNAVPKLDDDYENYQ